MTPFLLAYLGLAAFLAVLAWLLLVNVPRLRRAAFVVGFGILLATLFFGASDMLGRPKSTRLELLRMGTPDAVVLASVMIEGRGIYLWLKLPGVAEPRYYALPWDERTAKAMQDAQDENRGRHGPGIGLSMPFERSWDMEKPKFYPLPQPKLPDKPGETAPKIYNAPGSDA